MYKVNNANFEKEVYAKYYQLVYSTCLRKLHHKDSIDDAVQSTFLLYIKEQDKINSNLSSWLYWASKNTCTFMNRIASKNEMISNIEEELVKVEKNKNDISLDKMISSLPLKKSELLLMKYYDNLSYHEIAEKTNAKEETVKKIINRTISLLQSKFKKKDVLVAALLSQLFHANKASAALLNPNNFILQNSLIQQSIVKGVLKMVFIHKLNFILLSFLVAVFFCAGGLRIYGQIANSKEITTVVKNNSEPELSENKVKEHLGTEKGKQEVVLKKINADDIVTKTYKTKLYRPVYQLIFTLRRIQGSIFQRRLEFLYVKRENPIKFIKSNGDVFIQKFFFQVKCEKRILDMIDGIITNLLSEKTINKRFIIKDFDREFYVYIHYLDKKFNYKKSRPIFGGIQNRSLFLFPQKNAILMLSSKKNHSSCKKALDAIIEIHKK